MAQQEVDGSGRYAEAIGPPTSPSQRYSSPMSEMMDNTPPIPVEQGHGFAYTNERKHVYQPAAEHEGLETVEQNPPQYPGSPPPAQYYDKTQNGATTETGQQPGEEAAAPRQDERKIMGMKRRTFLIALIALIVVIILALGIGLGVDLKNNKSDDKTTIQDPVCRDHPEVCVGGALNAEFYSKKGAFNGTGIALAGESWNQNQRRIFTLYFQHHTGDLRYMQYRTDRQWEGGGKTYTVASDAKNGTAISAVSYALDGVQYFHLFYVGKNNTVKQITQSNSTDGSGHWEPGPLSNLNLKVFDSPTVGLQACWKGDYYGKVDTTNTTVVPTEDLRGINLWFAKDDSTFEQWSWNNAGNKWAKEDSSWQGKNTYAGVGCYSWETAPISYTMMMSDKNATEFYWIDSNSTAPSTTTHPTNAWKNSTGGIIEGVNPLTSYGYTNHFFMQMQDRSVQGYEINWAAENTSVKGEPFAVRDLGGPVLGISGTHLTNTAFAEFKPGQEDKEPQDRERLWDSLYVFYQTAGDDISAFTRPISGGEWTRGALNIPQE